MPPASRQLVPAGEWKTVLHTPTALVLYHPHSHALTALPHPFPPTSPGGHTPSEGSANGSRPAVCPLCRRPFEPDGGTDRDASHSGPSSHHGVWSDPNASASYFTLLSRANAPASSPSASSTGRLRTLFSLPSSSSSLTSKQRGPSVDCVGDGGIRPRPTRGGSTDRDADLLGEEDRGAAGYYARFFKEEGRLGMGANGSVYLCQHIIDDQSLGLYAVKKVAVGSSHDYLVQVLREVKLLQGLRHENIITYHHAWIEKTRFSSFGEKTPALHILMQFANSGSLEDFILARTLPALSTPPEELTPEQLKAARRRRKSGNLPEAHFRHGELRGVHLLGWEEIRFIFGGVVRGLQYLHNHGVLHLDLKCANVLLHLEDDLFPRPLISDFGTSRTSQFSVAEELRTGNTGTMEYCSPESMVLDAEGKYRALTREVDMWALGIILYKLLFLKLPYAQIDDFDILAADILAYEGFKPSPAMFSTFERRRLPHELLYILMGLLNIDPRKRLTCEQVLALLDSAPSEPSRFTPENSTLGSLAPFNPLRNSSSVAPRFDSLVIDRGPSSLSTGDEPFYQLAGTRAMSSGSINSIATETPTRPPSPKSRARLVHPPPYSPQSSTFGATSLPPPLRTLALASFRSAALLLAQFWALHLLLPRPPGALLQSLVLVLAAAPLPVLSSVRHEALWKVAAQAALMIVLGGWGLSSEEGGGGWRERLPVRSLVGGYW